MVLSNPTLPPPGPGQPAWEVARLFPNQGQWSETDYFRLNRLTNRFVELSDGTVEVLDMPTLTHQRIVIRVHEILSAFAKKNRLGSVVLAPFPLRLHDDKFREPDVLFVSSEHEAWLTEDYAQSADLVIEVVSKGDPRRDLVVKRGEYARAGIAEYWIVDPPQRAITVLRLEKGEYQETGLTFPTNGGRAAGIN
jgi:Uma2 family endonuclease